MTEPVTQDLWLAFVIGVFVLLVLTIALFARRERRPAPSTDAKLDALDRRLGTTDAMLAALDRRQDDQEKALAAADHDLRNIRMLVGNLPTKESINAIAVQVAESRGKMDGMQAALHGLTKSCDRIEDWLMKTSAEAIAGQKAVKPNNGDVG